MHEPIDTATLPPLASGERVDLVFVIDGQSTARPLPEKGRLVIGRGAETSVCVPHRSLSREHAALTLPDLVLEDLGSTNGTFVRALQPDGSTIETKVVAGKAVRLAPGSTVRFGAVTAVLVPSFVRTADDRAITTDAVALDPRMREIDALVARVAPSDIPVLILGETGVGKEVLAEKIHRSSTRRDRPMLKLNCAALSEQLVESELFGHEKGAFTGASVAKPGLIETAAGGTVMLDEIGDLRLEAQAKLLRVLEEGKVLRVGALAPRAVDVRFVAATHRDLEQSVTRGAFRRDLYFRLAGVVFRIPPLRERKSEILPLARGFLKAACLRYKRSFEPALSEELLEFLQHHAWTGNVRELRHSVERAVLLCDGPVLDVRHFDLSGPVFEASPAREPAASVASAAPPPPESPTTRNPLGLSRERIVAALEQHAGNQTRAAKSLGISRRTLVNWIERYGLARPRAG
ncbi:MAG: sigma 54-interacting transcriptional regulator [Myxococcales bacterium]|nr:sigma 54-interacting transcriptional regulator [Myxococcales bacterium]